MADIDTAALKENWATVAANGADEVALFFYSHLFLHHPETRDMFPPAMTRQRNRLVNALGRVVSEVDRLDQLVPYLQDLGRDHRKFGALSAHYPAVGHSLVETLRHYSGDAWTEALQEDWITAYSLVADTMIAAADEAAETLPAWWDAEVVAVERPTFDIGVLRVRVEGPPLPYEPGQSITVEPVNLRPREWRYYSPANAPRADATIDLHVRLVPGGPVSTVLARTAGVGERLRIGPPMGALTLDTESDRPLLLIGGGTGIAPLLALVDQVAAKGGRPTSLWFGVRSVRELYVRDRLAELDARHDWLDVTMAVSDDETYEGPQGLLSDLVVAAGDWNGHDAYVCGSPAMVEATIKHLVSAGVPEQHIRFDEFGEKLKESAQMTAYGDVARGDEPRSVSFAETRGFNRGYDEAEVDAYVARVSSQLADKDAELQAVRQEVDHLRSRLMSGDNERVLQSLNILTRAQRTADETVARADDHSARVMTEARQLHDEARRQAARIVEESHRRATEVADRAAADHGELARQTAYLQTMREVARTQIETFLMGLYDRIAEEYGRADPRAAADAVPARPARPAIAPSAPAEASAVRRPEPRPRPAAVPRPTGA